LGRKSNLTQVVPDGLVDSDVPCSDQWIMGVFKHYVGLFITEYQFLFLLEDT